LLEELQWLLKSTSTLVPTLHTPEVLLAFVQQSVPYSQHAAPGAQQAAPGTQQSAFLSHISRRGAGSSSGARGLSSPRARLARATTVTRPPKSKRIVAWVMLYLFLMFRLRFGHGGGDTIEPISRTRQADWLRGRLQNMRNLDKLADLPME
jgi:hypothetical protein